MGRWLCLSMVMALLLVLRYQVRHEQMVRGPVLEARARAALADAGLEGEVVVEFMDVMFLDVQADRAERGELAAEFEAPVRVRWVDGGEVGRGL